MKKYLLPAALAIAGIVFILLPYLFSSGNIELKIQPASVIMPAAYKVYANPDVAGGRYNLFKAVIKNTGSSEIHNFKVQFRVPKYIDDWTDVPAQSDLLPGQSAVVTCFPVFNQSITEKNTSSKEKTEIRFFYGGKSNPTEKDESFVFDMTSVNDMVFSDMSDKDKAYSSDGATNIDLYACMVASQDPIIKYYAQQVQQKVLKGEQAAGVGTAGTVDGKTVREALRVMEGVYEATALTKMVYSETSASETKFGDNSTSTEHIRLPREVVTGNTGLCIELALLHASVLKAAGDHAVIFLIPGHAYPGIKLGNSYYALEATGIGGEGLGGTMTADQALQAGMKEANDFFTAVQQGKPGYYLLDLDELSQEGYKEMEMKDDPFLRQKVDQLAQNFQAGNTPQQPQPQQNDNGGGGQTVDNNNADNTNTNNTNTNNTNTNNTDNTKTVSMATHSGNISFQYPSSWAQKKRPFPQLPILITTFSSGKHGSVEIYQVPGASSAEQAMNYIQQSLMKLGVRVTFGADGEQNGLTRFTGVSVGAQGMSFRWEGFFKSVNGGVEGAVVGAGPNSAFTATQKQIMNTMQ
ncbi:MAG: hypothetical protein ABIY62_08775 [Ginsengibacter sp.]